MAKTTDLDAHINSIAAGFARDIAAAVKQAIADQILGASGGARRGRPAGVALKTRAPSAKAGKAAKKASAPRPCPVCGKPGKGPRFGFHCEEHKSKHKPKAAVAPATASAPKKAKAKSKRRAKAKPKAAAAK
jgi:hypothetical protein